MAVIEFSVERVLQGYQYRVQRQAAMAPLLGSTARDVLSDEQAIGVSTLKLVGTWRRRVRQLAAAGYPGLADEAEPDDDEPDDDPDAPAAPGRAARNRTFAMNCQPAFAVMEQKTRRCTRRCCPFCWARGVRTQWLAIDAAFFGAEQARCRTSSYRLVARSLNVVFQRRPTDGEGVEIPIERNVDRFLKIVSAGWSKGMSKRPGVRGVLYAAHFTFTRQHQLQANVRWVIMASPSFKIPPEWSSPIKFAERVCHSITGQCRAVDRPRRGNVMNAVAWACRYPAFLMRGPAAQVTQLARLTGGCRLVQRYGGFRIDRREPLVRSDRPQPDAARTNAAAHASSGHPTSSGPARANRAAGPARWQPHRG